MALSCEQMDAQVIDFLYGELSPDARAAFAAHLTGCDRCRREVEALGHTRALARAGLDEAPPTHLRAQIVAAARAAVPVTVPIAAAPVRAGFGFWRWLRGRWAFPTLATAGALAIFLLGGRAFWDAKHTVERGRNLVAPAEPHVEPAARARASASSSSSSSSSSSATPEARQPAKPVRSRAPAPEARRVGASGGEDDLDGIRLGAVAKKSKTPPADRVVDRVGDSSAHDRATGGAASPNEKAPAAAALADEGGQGRVPVARSEAVEAEVDDAEPLAARSTRASRSRGGVDKGYPAPPAPAPSAAQATGAAAEPPASSPPASVAAKRAAGPAKADAPRAETLVQRADRLFTEGRWVEAAVAYRDLLRQDPASVDAPRWRGRLAAARSAANAVRPAPP
jgi:Putative zinc-finger